MKIYVYNEITKEYVGDDIPQYDFKASERLGYDSWITPKNSTFQEPPILKENEIAVFNEGKNDWEVKEDYRGLKVYNKKTGNPYIIKEIGSIPTDYSLEKPFILQDEKVKKIEEVNTKYKEEQNKRVPIGKIEENIFVRSKLIELINFIKDETFGTFESSEGTSYILTKEELEVYAHYYYLRSLLLALKKEEIISKIKVCKGKAQFKKIDINFNIEKELKEIENLSKKEIEDYIKERT